MRALLSTDSRGGAEPLVGLAVRLRELGAVVRVCPPPNCAKRPAEVGMPLVLAGRPVRSLVGPQMADQPYWAGRVAELGIGSPAPTAESLAATPPLDAISREKPPVPA